MKIARVAALAAALAVASSLAGSSADQVGHQPPDQEAAPLSLSGALRVAYVLASSSNSEPRTHGDNVYDATGVALTPLLETFTDEELAGAGPLAIVWATHDMNSAFVPYYPSNYPECLGVERCIILSRTRWVNDGLTGGVNLRRNVIAHEFGHVLSFERTDDDRVEYPRQSQALGEECVADGIARVTLARNDWPAPTSFYASCADRTVAADALAEDLLVWAAYRWDSPIAPVEPVAVEIAEPATAAAGAVRGAQEEAA